MAKLLSEGVCVYCDKTYKKAGIGKHLATHLKKLEAESTSSKKAFHIKVTAAEMFLHLLVPSTNTFGDIDSFLRQIWLECCGHMSSFSIKGKHYSNDFDAMEFGEKMSAKIEKSLVPGMKIDYEYDFGSTTQLSLEVVNIYKMPVPKEILLLSRNEPLPILCHSCHKKPAESICIVCYENSFFCKSCAKKHTKRCEDFADYAQAEVINSPRMGVCGYDGGTIDTKRDGAWKGE